MEHINCDILSKNKFIASKYNILIVEDSKSVNKILYETLTSKNFNCYTVFNLQDAFEYLKKYDIHYIMLDMNLPDGNGYEIIEKLENSSIKIFVLTNEKDEQLRNNAYQKGVIDYIIKDKSFFYKIDQISQTIEQLEKNKNKTVLIVEDSIVIQKQLKNILVNRFYNIKTADDTKTMLNILNSQIVDLILLDIELKNSNGIEFLQTYHNEIINIKKIPVFIVSGSITASTIRDGLKAGAKDVIKKPYVIEEIILKVDTWIDYKRKEEESQCSIKLLEEYKEAVDGSALVSKTDPNGLITYANDKFVKISGFKLTELIGNQHKILRSPDMAQEIFKNMWHTIKDLKSPWTGKIKNISKDGTPYWVNAYIKPILNTDGEIVEFIGIRNDITELEQTKKELEITNHNIKDSIQYASLIQNTLIPSNQLFSKYFKDHFTYWEPKDIVGGDIYLFEELRDDNECLLMMIDCTGHGVPGAFVTMIVKSLERKIISEIEYDPSKEVSPSEILNHFNKEMKKILKQENKDSLSNVGFDGAIIYYNKKDNIVKFSSANTPLFYIDNTNTFNIIKGSKHSVGYKNSDSNFHFEEHCLKIEKNMKFYLTTDGYLDQNGGEKSFPFSKKRFQQTLQKHYSKPFEEQKKLFVEALTKYQGDEERNDDITLIGFEI